MVRASALVCSSAASELGPDDDEVDDAAPNTEAERLWVDEIVIAVEDEMPGCDEACMMTLRDESYM